MSQFPNTPAFTGFNTPSRIEADIADLQHTGTIPPELDGAFYRVHHFARQLGSPFPILAAVGARTKKIEIGTAVIDMRYENPLYMVEDAGAADIIAGGSGCAPRVFARVLEGVRRGPTRSLSRGRGTGGVRGATRETPLRRRRSGRGTGPAPSPPRRPGPWGAPWW